jgi:hypothetical protein
MSFSTQGENGQSNTNSSSLSGGSSLTLTVAGIGSDGLGGLGNWMQEEGGKFRSTRGAYYGSPMLPKNWSPRHYPNSWGGGSTARITTYSMVKYGKIAGNTGTLASIGLGVYSINENYQKEAGFGVKTQQATGGLAGNLAGSALGGSYGASVGPYGAIGGAIVGGFIGQSGVEWIIRQLQNPNQKK